MFKNIGEIKAANKALGHHWFDVDSMNFFNTRVRPEIHAGRYFITGDRMNYGDAERFAIRRANDDGSIDTIGELREYPSVTHARHAITRLTN